MYYERLRNSKSHRYRIFDNIEEIRKIIYEKDNVYPLTLEIRPTNVCNADCKFCICRNSRNDEMLSVHVMTQLIDEIIDSSKINAVVFSGGGDPSLHPYLSIAIKRLYNAGIEIGIITNGIYLNEELLSSYILCSWIRISLNSLNGEEYFRITRTSKETFDLVCNNIKKITSFRRYKNKKLYISISVVVSNENCNINYLSRYIPLANNLDVDMVMYRKNRQPNTHYNSLSKEVIDQLLALQDEYKIYTNIDKFLGTQVKRDEKRSNYCCLVQNNIISFIDACGDIFPCLYFTELGSNSFGNINSDSYITCIKASYEIRKNISNQCKFYSKCKNYFMNELICKYINEKNLGTSNDPHWKFL